METHWHLPKAGLWPLPPPATVAAAWAARWPYPPRLSPAKPSGVHGRNQAPTPKKNMFLSWVGTLTPPVMSDLERFRMISSLGVGCFGLCNPLSHPVDFDTYTSPFGWKSIFQFTALSQLHLSLEPRFEYEPRGLYTQPSQVSNNMMVSLKTLNQQRKDSQSTCGPVLWSYEYPKSHRFHGASPVVPSFSIAVWDQTSWAMSLVVKMTQNEQAIAFNLVLHLVNLVQVPQKIPK